MKNQLLPPNVILTPGQAFYDTGIQPAPANPVPKKTKSERQIDALVSYLTNSQVNGGRVFLCKNLLGTKYLVWDFQIIFFGEDKLVDCIKSDVYFQTWQNMTDTVIKSALQIISGQQSLWIDDGEEKRITPIRSMSLYRGHFIYFYNSNYFVTNKTDNIYMVGTFFSKSSRIIQPPSNPHFLNEFGSSSNHNLMGSLDFLKETLFKNLNISEDYLLIILTWLIQSIASDNHTLLELIGESNSGKTYAQKVFRELIDPNLELITQVPKKIKDLERQTMNGKVDPSVQTNIH